MSSDSSAVFGITERQNKIHHSYIVCDVVEFHETLQRGWDDGAEK